MLINVIATSVLAQMLEKLSSLHPEIWEWFGPHVGGKPRPDPWKGIEDVLSAAEIDGTIRHLSDGPVKAELTRAQTQRAETAISDIQAQVAKQDSSAGAPIQTAYILLSLAVTISDGAIRSTLLKKAKALL